MAITIDPLTYVISVPKADLTLVQSTPTEVRELDINWFRLQLKDLEDEANYMPLPKTHTHNTEVSLGGLTFARIVEILDPYTITFEDGQYAINFVGANTNVADKTNVNQVSVRPNNSAGMVSFRLVAEDLSNIINGVLDTVLSTHTEDGSLATTVEAVRKAFLNRAVRASDNSTSIIYEDDGVTPYKTFDHPTPRERVPR